MSEAGEANDAMEFEAAMTARPGEALIVEVDGFEGPLDLLLSLAREQKVDLAKISVLQLAEQYLVFVERAKAHNLELAADYLVMAAWLAYLKSRLVLPQPPAPADPTAEEMAAGLRWRLQRLAAMREAAARIMARDRLGREVFARGDPEPTKVVRLVTYKDTLFDLLTAYSQRRLKALGHRVYEMQRAPIFLIEEARERVERMLGHIPDWSGLARFLPIEWRLGVRVKSALASTFLACLELVRDGKLEIRQIEAFGEIFVKDRASRSVGEGLS